MSHIVIIGNGIAGITAARHIRKKSSDHITVVSGETDHFFSRTALMYVYMGHMKYEHTKPYEDWFWKKNKIDLIKGWVQAVDFKNKTLSFSHESLNYDKLILATGSKTNKFGWSGQDLNGVQGLYHYQDLAAMETHTNGIASAVVVGGGLIGIEMAEMLHSRGIKVTFLVREKNFWDIVLPENEAKMINRHIREYHIDLRLATELKEILDDGTGRVGGVVTQSGEKIACQFVGLAVGVSPNIGFLRDSGLDINKGILVNEYLETNQPDVYAIGDCAELKSPASGRRPVEAVWYTGRIMGETVAKTITGKQTAYNPGIWFNSAKFFDIEYQTYGHVPAQLPEELDSFYWECTNGKKCINVIFHKQNRNVVGVNTLGIRMRHEVWNKWISEGKKLEEIISAIRQCFFDPEFFKQYHLEITHAYNNKFPEKPLTIRKRGLLEKLIN